MGNDSRSLKIAHSFARAGWESRILETKASDRGTVPAGLHIHTLWPGRKITAPEGATGRQGLGGEFFHFLRFVFLYFFVFPVQGFFIPIDKPRLYYLHEYRLFPLALVLKFRHRAPIVYDAHDFYTRILDETETSRFWRAAFSPLIRAMDRWSARYSDLVVTTSEGYARLFQMVHAVTPGVVRNAHDPALDSRDVVPIKHTVGLSAEDILIVVVGHRKAGQAVEQLLEALTSLPERIHVAFVGRGYERDRPIAERLGVAGRCHFTGARHPLEIVPFLKDADLSSILYFGKTDNYRFTIPNGLFQSIAAGLPVAMADLPGMASVEPSQLTRLFMDPLNPRSIARALETLIGRIENGEIPAAELHRVAQTVSWKKEEEVLFDLVKPLLDRPAEIR